MEPVKPLMGDAEALAWAKDQKWEFGGYYKYMFIFTAEGEGVRGHLSTGGQAESIYRLSIDAGEPLTWDEACYPGHLHLTLRGPDESTLWAGDLPDDEA